MNTRSHSSRSTHRFGMRRRGFAALWAWLLLFGSVLWMRAASAEDTGPALGSRPAPAGLLNWWPGDGNPRDIQSANHGTLGGKVSFPAGKVGQAFGFDGTDGFVRANVAFAAVDNWSMAAWVFWQGPSQALGSTGEAVIYHGDGDRNGYGLYIVGTKWCEEFPPLCPHVGELTVLHGGVAWNFPGVALDQNTWNHVVVMRQQGISKLYKNGRLVWTDSAAAPPNVPSSNFHTSTRPPFTFNGLIDEVCLFADALSDEAVQAVFAAGEHGMCKSPEFTDARQVNIGQIEFKAKGQTGKDVTVMVSIDLVGWEPLVRLPNLTGWLQFSDPNPESFGKRFYRLAPGN